MFGTVWRSEHRRHGKCGWNGGNLYVTGEAALQRIDLLPHRTRVGHDAPRPFEYAFTFGREALKSRAALHQQHAKRVLKLLDAGR